MGHTKASLMNLYFDFYRTETFRRGIVDRLFEKDSSVLRSSNVA